MIDEKPQSIIKKYRDVLFGLLFFAAAMVIFWFIAPPVQYKFGLYGLGITEILLFAIAFTGALTYKFISRKTIKEIFPVNLKSFSFKNFIDSLSVYLGAYFFTVGTQNILLRIFPGMIEISNAMIDFFSRGGFIAAVVRNSQRIS